MRLRLSLKMMKRMLSSTVSPYDLECRSIHSSNKLCTVSSDRAPGSGMLNCLDLYRASESSSN
ncbi:hypothetical protein Mapa_016816 [Marchantia paleacea]|nr:hypothetical protein Mapa_016816 [Marchantia paleacea]